MGADFRQILNRLVEPLVRAGIGSPGPWPTGAIVLETRGRTSGRTLRVPLLATLIGDLVLVGTIRRRSQWTQNVAHTPRVRYWMHGRPREAAAVVVGPGVGASARGTMSPFGNFLEAGLTHVSDRLGITFVILGPVTPTS
ncbi:MAG: nitroreductase/quinone reductase family protein [Candidatus Rokuibacteriota bacterium]